MGAEGGAGRLRVVNRQTALRPSNHLRLYDDLVDSLAQHYIHKLATDWPKAPQLAKTPCSRLGWTAANSVPEEYVSADFTSCAIQTDSFPSTAVGLLRCFLLTSMYRFRLSMTLSKILWMSAKRENIGVVHRRILLHLPRKGFGLKKCELLKTKTFLKQRLRLHLKCILDVNDGKLNNNTLNWLFK